VSPGSGFFGQREMDGRCFHKTKEIDRKRADEDSGVQT
jgi:hypothetical protein